MSAPLEGGGFMEDGKRSCEYELDLIHKAACVLELTFRRTQDCLRTAQCELPLNTRNGEKLRKSEAFVLEGLRKIYEIQELASALRKMKCQPSNGHQA